MEPRAWGGERYGQRLRVEILTHPFRNSGAGLAIVMAG